MTEPQEDDIVIVRYNDSISSKFSLGKVYKDGQQQWTFWPDDDYSLRRSFDPEEDLVENLSELRRTVESLQKQLAEHDDPRRAYRGLLQGDI